MLSPAIRHLLFAILALLCASTALAADHTGRDENLRDNTTGDKAKLLLHDNGDGTYSMQVYVAGGIGGGGDATAANQVTGNNSLASIVTNLGAKADTVASSDTGTFSLIALVKRVAQTLTAIANSVTTIASNTGAATPAGTNLIGKVGIDQTTPGTTNAVSDAGAAWTASNGIAGARFTSADQSGAVASVTDAPTSGQKLVITDCMISVDTTMRVDFTVESSATVIETVYMAANTSFNLVTRSKWKLPTVNKKLQVQTSVAGNISVNPRYYSEP